MAFTAITNFSIELLSLNQFVCMAVASLFMGSIYPLTQIYQHEADKKDGVISISYKLGYIGTFIFSSILFSLATIALFYYFKINNRLIYFVLFIFIMLPVIFKLSVWFNKVRVDTQHANFENTMTMNLLTSVCMNSYFLILILNNHLTWF
jgi:1,4-dihydroxy-2-naphthoate octaprenyltransferase